MATRAIARFSRGSFRTLWTAMPMTVETARKAASNISGSVSAFMATAAALLAQRARTPDGEEQPQGHHGRDHEDAEGEHRVAEEAVGGGRVHDDRRADDHGAHQQGERDLVADDG